MKPVNASVMLDGRPLDMALKALKRKCESFGLRAAMKRSEYYLKPGDRRRLKANKARQKRHRDAKREAAQPPVSAWVGKD